MKRMCRPLRFDGIGVFRMYFLSAVSGTPFGKVAIFSTSVHDSCSAGFQPGLVM